jgi:hypothetical protein
MASVDQDSSDDGVIAGLVRCTFFPRTHAIEADLQEPSWLPVDLAAQTM